MRRVLPLVLLCVSPAAVAAGTGAATPAAEDFRAALATSFDPAMIDRVVTRWLESERVQHGVEGEIVALAELVRSDRPAVAERAGRRMTALLRELAASPTLSPERAAFLVQLVGSVDRQAGIPPALRLAAAALWESVGDCARAARDYETLAYEPPPVGRDAARGLARCRPPPATAATPARGVPAPPRGPSRP